MELFRTNSLDIADVHTLLFLGQNATAELCSFSVSNGFQRLQSHEIRREGEFRVERVGVQKERVLSSSRQEGISGKGLALGCSL